MLVGTGWGPRFEMEFGIHPWDLDRLSVVEVRERQQWITDMDRARAEAMRG